MSLNHGEFDGIAIYEPSHGGTWGNGYEHLNSQINQLIHKIPTSQMKLLLHYTNELGDADQGNNHYRLNFRDGMEW
jgi:protein-tyrosine phosphatase